MEYVVGFMYSEDHTEVALIKKTRPDWQKGKLNGIGGKIEPDELPLDAMIREFKEETGCNHKYWNFFCELRGDWGTVHFFYTIGALTELKTMEDEEVGIYKVADIPNLNTIPNLRWLVPMGIDKDEVVAYVSESV